MTDYDEDEWARPDPDLRPCRVCLGHGRIIEHFGNDSVRVVECTVCQGTGDDPADKR